MGHRISNWKTLRLGELCEKIDYGITASAVHAEKGPRFLRITDIQTKMSIGTQFLPALQRSEKEPKLGFRLVTLYLQEQALPQVRAF